jgi:hypothetical protein
VTVPLQPVTDRDLLSRATGTWTETVKKEPSVPKKAKSWKFCPADFQPSEAHRLLARQLTVNLEVELAKFRDHEYAKPKTDPGRAFATWLRTASEYKRNGTNGSGPSQSYDPRTVSPFSRAAP